MCGSIGKYEAEQKWMQDYVGETEIKKPLGKFKRGGEERVKSTSSKSVGKACTGLIWLSKGQGRAVVEVVMNIRIT